MLLLLQTGAYKTIANTRRHLQKILKYSVIEKSFEIAQLMSDGVTKIEDLPKYNTHHFKNNQRYIKLLKNDVNMYILMMQISFKFKKNFKNWLRFIVKCELSFRIRFSVLKPEHYQFNSERAIVNQICLVRQLTELIKLNVI